MSRQPWWFVLAAAACLLVCATVDTSTASAAVLVNPVGEGQNLQVSQQRQAQFAPLLGQVLQAGAQYQLQRARVDSGRSPNPNTCTTAVLCPIDPRLNDWSMLGGIVKPVLYTARSGATLSGHVWATEAGPDKRPGVVIINGSIVGFEQIYWYAAQALARAGFVVITFDTQGEGMSDQFGQAPDQREGAFAGTPALSLPRQLGGSGIPFYDGGEDTLDFFLATPAHPYRPMPSRTSGTSHDAKQQQRVAAGLDAAYNPLWHMVDQTELGVAGHSYGAEAASWLAQKDPRLKAGVAWDTLCTPVSPSPDEAVAALTSPVNSGGAYGLPTPCFGAPPGPAPTITKPVLGLTSDYALFPDPYLTAPDPEAKNQASLAYTAAGVPTGEIAIRGGTHYEFNDTATGAIPASKRGIDLTTWYTTAWFAKYLQHDPRADAQLTTSRWRSDSAAEAVDPTGDGNIYSYHYRSRLDIQLTNGAHFACDNLRVGCSRQTNASRDCGADHYSFVAIDRRRVPAYTCQASTRKARNGEGE